VVTVRGSAESIESRLLSGVLRCPCGGRLGPWAHARPRMVAMEGKLEEFWPRRGRCRRCGRTQVLLPADLWSRRRYGAAVIMAVLVLGVRAAVAGRVAARPFAAAPGGRRRVPASTARSWRSRFAGRAGALREQLMRLLPLGPGREASRPLAPSGSPAGDCLAVLEAVTAGLRERFPRLAAVSAHEMAAHLSGGRWLAPGMPALEFNTTLFPGDAVSPS
jgi:hypothetical protein